jgi:hypothetical protein
MKQMTFAGMAGKPGITVANANKTITINAGCQATSDMIDLPIDRTKSYLISFRLDTTPGSGAIPCWVDFRSPTRTHAYWIQNDTGREGVASWSGAGVPIFYLYWPVSVLNLFATYPDTSTYTSTIFDTKLAAPAYGQLKWHATIPAGGLQPTFKVRTGANPDLSDAPSWDSALAVTTASPASLTSLPPGRYVQFQATLKSVAPYNQTVKLQDVMVTWAGAPQAVDIQATLQKGPDKGKFQLLVDGEPCAGATVRAYFKISKRFMNETLVRALTVEAQPRNH